MRGSGDGRIFGPLVKAFGRFGDLNVSKTSCSDRKLEVLNAKRRCVTSQVLGVAPAEEN